MMVIMLKPTATEAEARDFCVSLEKFPVEAQLYRDTAQAVISLAGNTSAIDRDALQAHPLVERIFCAGEPYKLAGRGAHPADTVIEIESCKKTRIGGGALTVIAGPCSVESREQIETVAREVKNAGAAILRGGAFKPRTSPYDFQGMGFEGIDLLLEVKKSTDMAVVSEIMDIRELESFRDIDIIQVGARNMQNFILLKELGGCGKPVLIKRGLASTINELLMAAEYVMAGGNGRIILCERGIRSFDSSGRNILDLAAVPVLKKKSHLPVIVDPSHASGAAWLVPSMSKAAVAAGADGLMIEVHNNPENALCDGEQSLTPGAFASLMDTLRKYAAIEGLAI
jgi:3-deoxy-7-phosphoheptulonate synthase